MPRITRGRGSRHTGTSAPAARAASISRGSSPPMRFARASRRNAAAASAEPPPSPAATGRRFDSVKRPSFQTLHVLRQRARSLEHEIVADRASGRRGRPADGERERARRRKRQRVADAGKYHQALDVMIAVRPAADARAASG